MKLKWAIVLTLAIALLAKFTCDQLKPPFPVGASLPQFELKDIGGNVVRLNDFKGTPLLVHFWATWCSQCVKEIPHLDSFARSSQNIKVIAINEDEGGLEAVNTFFAGGKPSFTVLFDPDNLIGDLYKSYKVPETYLVDANGNFVHFFAGPVPWDTPETIVFINKKLGR